MASNSPREMLESLARNLPNRTGKTLEQWARLVKTKGPKTTRERVAWLRKHHSLGGPTAAVIVAKAEGQDLAAPYEAGDQLVESMFSGGKAELKPIYEAAVRSAATLGKDVVVSPCDFKFEAHHSLVPMETFLRCAVTEPLAGPCEIGRDAWKRRRRFTWTEAKA